MLTPDLFQFLRSGGALRRYRNDIRSWLQQTLPARLFPQLLDLPLIADGSTVTSAASLLARRDSLALYGAPGSGRSLALLQIAWHWAGSSRNDPLLILSLPQIDNLNLAPQVILSRVLQSTALAANLDGAEEHIPRRRWLLLLDGWAHLPSPRRNDWHAFILDLPGIWPEAQLILALPETKSAAPSSRESWPTLQPVHLATPDDELLETWLRDLLPDHDPQPLFDAVAPGEPLVSLRRRLLDVALLALVYARHGLPGSLAQFYEQGCNLVSSELAHMSPADQLSGSQWSLDSGQIILERYRLAREIAAGSEIAAVSLLDEDERADVARMLVSMLADPVPLYGAVWGASQPVIADLLTLGYCLSQRPMAAPQWALQILTALKGQRENQHCRRLLDDLAPVIPNILAAAAEAGFGDQALALLEDLIDLCDATALAMLVDTTIAGQALRWVAADRFLRLPPGTARDILVAAPPPDQLAQALRCYVLLLGDDDDREFLAEPEMQPWVHALATALKDSPRRGPIINALAHAGRLPTALRSTLLTRLSPLGEADTLTMVAQGCADSEPRVRRAALISLRNYEPLQALAVLKDLLFDPKTAWDIWSDCLECLASYRLGEASVLLARCAVSERLPLVGRLRALALLARRRAAGPLLLQRILNLETARPAVRATAAWLIGVALAQLSTSSRDVAVLPEQYTPILADLCRIAVGDGPVVIRQGAVAALGLVGHYTPDRALAALKAALVHASTDSQTAIVAAWALGQFGATESMSTLQALVQSDLADHLRAAWLERAPRLDSMPAGQWRLLALPADARVTLMTLMTEGQTLADQPSTIAELTEYEATLVRTAAAGALASISRQAEGALQREAWDTLYIACCRSGPAYAVRQLLACITQASDDAGLHNLGRFLTDPAIDPPLRWLAIEQLENGSTAAQVGPAVADMLLAYLEHGAPDPFTGGKLVQVLGRLGSLAALPTICRLADQADGDPHLQTQAIAALGMLRNPAAETALIHIVANNSIAATLRGAAAMALPETCAAETRQTLRELLRHDRQPPELVAGILQALGRMRDREALSSMLHFAQSDNPDEAVAALTAVAAFNDANFAGVMLQVAQNTLVEQSIRLHAIGCLLQVCGAEHVPLLRRYLEAAEPSLRLQALNYLLAIQPDDPYPLTLARTRTAPLALRLRAVAALAARPADQAALCALLCDTNDDEQLRGQTATLLGEYGEAQAVAALTQCAMSDDSGPLLRRRCINALDLQARSSRPCAVPARLALSKIADDPTQTDELRAWATHALRHILDVGFAISDCAVGSKSKTANLK